MAKELLSQRAKREEVIMKLIKFILVVPFLMLLINCGNKDNNNQQPTYYMSNGSCYSSNGQVVSPSYCPNAYGTNSGTCYPGQLGGTSCAGNGIPQSCMGQYMEYCPMGPPTSAGGTCQGGQWGVCGASCRGYTLYTQQGQAVVCQ